MYISQVFYNECWNQCSYTDVQFECKRFINSLKTYIDKSNKYLTINKEKELFNWLIRNTSYRENMHNGGTYDEFQPRIYEQQLRNVGYWWLYNNGFKSAAKLYKRDHPDNLYLKLPDVTGIFTGFDDTFIKYVNTNI